MKRNIFTGNRAFLHKVYSSRIREIQMQQLSILVIFFVLAILPIAVHGANYSENISSLDGVKSWNVSSINSTSFKSLDLASFYLTPIKPLNLTPIKPLNLTYFEPYDPFDFSVLTAVFSWKGDPPKSAPPIGAMQKVEASEILAKIQKGEPVEYHQVIVKGNLDLSRSMLQKNIITSVRINDSLFEGFIDFRNVIFDKSLDLSGSNLTEGGDFRQGRFGGAANFRGTIFNRTANFRGAIFNGSADFDGVLFRGIQSETTTFWGDLRIGYESREVGTFKFRGAMFRGPTSFSGTTFNGNVDFRDGIFSEDAFFIGAKFNGYADFSETIFDEDINFNGASFSAEGASFGKATFKRDADFTGTTFSGTAHFTRGIFRGDVSFSEATFEKDIDFSGSKANGFIEISGSRFSRYLP